MNSKQYLLERINSRQEGWSLEQPFYTDPEVFSVEMDRIFRRYWLFAGHISQLPKAGDYFTYEIGNDSIIIIRDDDRKIRALFNVCRHRGSRICLEHSGHAQNLVCPYHQWIYGKNGELLKARATSEDFNKTSFSLHDAHIRVIEGLIFISFAKEPPDFGAVEQDIVPHLKPYMIEKTKIAHTQRYQIHSNWKLWTENFRECYHCPTGHPELCRVFGSCSLEELKLNKANGRRSERLAHWQKLGFSTNMLDLLPTTWHSCFRIMMKEGCVSMTLDGRPVGSLLGNLTEEHRDSDVFSMVICPTLWFQACSDYAYTLRLKPLAPTLTEIEVNWLVREDARDGVDYNLERLIALWRTSAEQDFKLCENNQSGVNSSRYQPGPYTPGEEDRTEIFVQWYLRQLKTLFKAPRQPELAYEYLSGT